MVFPFKIQHKRAFAIKPNSNLEDLLTFLKESLVIESSNSASDFVINQNELKFKIRFANTGLYTDTDGVRKGTFQISNDNNLVTLTYNYYMGGGSFISISVFSILALIAIFFSRRTNHYNKNGFFLLAGIYFVIWLATLFKQNRMFNAIAKKTECKFGLYQTC